MVYNVSRFYSGTGFRFAIGYLLPFLVTDTYQTPERNGMNCSAGCRVRQAASFPADSPLANCRSCRTIYNLRQLPLRLSNQTFSRAPRDSKYSNPS